MISYLIIKNYFNISPPYATDYGIGGAEINKMNRPLGGNYKNIESLENEINEIIQYCCPEKSYKIIYQNYKNNNIVKCYECSFTEHDEVSYTDLDIIEFLSIGGTNTVSLSQYGSGEKFLNESQSHIETIEYQLKNLYAILEKKYDWENLKNKIYFHQQLNENVLIKKEVNKINKIKI